MSKPEITPQKPYFMRGSDGAMWGRWSLWGATITINLLMNRYVISISRDKVMSKDYICRPSFPFSHLGHVKFILSLGLLLRPSAFVVFFLNLFF